MTIWTSYHSCPIWTTAAGWSVTTWRDGALRTAGLRVLVLLLLLERRHLEHELLMAQALHLGLLL